MMLAKLSVGALLVCQLVAVALYGGIYGAANPQVLTTGSIIEVWTAEQPTPGNGTTAASTAVALSPGPNGTPFFAHGKFSGAPGAFELDVQVSAVDTDTQYQTVANGAVTTVDTTNNTFHFDATLANARYARLLMRTRANAVTITASLGR